MHRLPPPRSVKGTPGEVSHPGHLLSPPVEQTSIGNPACTPPMLRRPAIRPPPPGLRKEAPPGRQSCASGGRPCGHYRGEGGRLRPPAHLGLAVRRLRTRRVRWPLGVHALGRGRRGRRAAPAAPADRAQRRQRPPEGLGLQSGDTDALARTRRRRIGPQGFRDPYGHLGLSTPRTPSVAPSGALCL